MFWKAVIKYDDSDTKGMNDEIVYAVCRANTKKEAEIILGIFIDYSGHSYIKSGGIDIVEATEEEYEDYIFYEFI